MRKKGEHQFSVSSETSRLGRYEACERCRRRHIRCQRRAAHLPCNNCKKAKTKCAGKGDVFRAVHYSSLSDRGATKRSRHFATTTIDQSPSEVNTVDESPTLHEGSIASQQSAAPEDPNFSESPAHDAWVGEHLIFPDASIEIEAGNDCDGLLVPSSLSDIPGRDISSGISHSTQHLDLQQPSPAFSSVLSTTSQSSSFWPLKTEFEASLFQHFLVELSPWFDYCDPQKHFRNYVANAAATNKTLLFAIFAVSARHKSQSCSSNRYLVFAEECQQSCLNSLISALNDYDTTVEENVFASALILRLIEEMTEPQSGSNVTSHTLSAQLLIRMKAGNVTESIFADAAFLVTLRQEIFICNLTQNPVGSIAEHCNIDSSLSPTSDPMWACRTMALAAQATDFAYGDNESRTPYRWQCLMQYLHDWETLRPPSFEPIFRGGQDEAPDTFPRLHFCSDYHVAASQYSELARILLLASDPSDSKLRIGRLSQAWNHDEAIRESVRLICGVALANRQYMPARSTAGLVISMCGELFHDPSETRVLFELLTDAESHLGWPALKLKDDLKRLWRLSDV